MTQILLSIEGAISQGIVWGFLALGVYLSYRILECADLTVEGSFAMGGAISAVCIINDMGLVASVALAIIGGALAGVVTGILTTKFSIPSILSGILTMIALYSINMRIMGRANIPLLGETTMFTKMVALTGLTQQRTVVLLGILVSIIVILLLWAFLNTELGKTIIATGNNQAMVRAQGVNTDFTIILGLAISNALVGLSGALVAQSQGYADIDMGVGSIVIGLASVIIAEVIFGKRFGFAYKFAAVMFGSIIYRIIITFVLRFGLQTTDLKLFTALIIAIALSLPTIKEKYYAKFK